VNGGLAGARGRPGSAHLRWIISAQVRVR